MPIAVLLAALLTQPPSDSGTSGTGQSGAGQGGTTVFRSPPASPPPPGSPPTSPPPPQPPGLCLDTCNRETPTTNLGRGDPSTAGRRLQTGTSATGDGSGWLGVCDDGLAGSVATSTCDPGTDCTDCGHRSLCTSCPDECAAQISSELFCLEDMCASTPRPVHRPLRRDEGVGPYHSPSRSFSEGRCPRDHRRPKPTRAPAHAPSPPAARAHHASADPTPSRAFVGPGGRIRTRATLRATPASAFTGAARPRRRERRAQRCRRTCSRS